MNLKMETMSMDSLAAECVKIIQDKEDAELRLEQDSFRKAQDDAYQKRLDAFNREYTTLYTAKVHSWLPDGSWLKDGDTLRVIEGKAGKKARLSMFGEDIDLDDEITSLEDYIAELQASLSHLKNAKELIDE